MSVLVSNPPRFLRDFPPRGSESEDLSTDSGTAHHLVLGNFFCCWDVPVQDVAVERMLEDQGEECTRSA